MMGPMDPEAMHNLTVPLWHCKDPKLQQAQRSRAWKDSIIPSLESWISPKLVFYLDFPPCIYSKLDMFGTGH